MTTRGRKEAGTEGSPQEERLEKIFTALNELMNKRVKRRFNYNHPKDSGRRFVIKREIDDESSFKVFLNLGDPSSIRIPFTPNLIPLIFKFERGKGVTQISLAGNEIEIPNAKTRFNLAGEMFYLLGERNRVISDYFG